jgi:hypothetical protein
MMKIKLPENYTIELEVTGSSCFGRIYHPGIRHYVNKIGYFIASISEESQTIFESIVIDLSLRNDLKFDPGKNISVDARNPQGFAGPDIMLSRLSGSILTAPSRLGLIYQKYLQGISSNTGTYGKMVPDTGSSGRSQRSALVTPAGGRALQENNQDLSSLLKR